LKAIALLRCGVRPVLGEKTHQFNAGLASMDAAAVPCQERNGVPGVALWYEAEAV
jgi:hypothetical protein